MIRLCEAVAARLEPVRVTLAIMSLAVLLGTAPAAVAQDDGRLENGGERYVYSVKIFCRGPTTTTVNVHNVRDQKVAFTKKVVVANSQGEERGEVSDRTKEFLRPNRAVSVDCENARRMLGRSAPPTEGFVVVESKFPLQVVAGYGTSVIEHKQEALCREVSEPFKVHKITENGRGTRAGKRKQALPDPGKPPKQNMSAEVLAVDYEYLFDMGKFQPWQEVYAEQTDLIKQEATYRWVSEPFKAVGDFVQDSIMTPSKICRDDDQDGDADEDPAGDDDGDGDPDDDGDGKVDEDGPAGANLTVEVMSTNIGVGLDQDMDVEYIDAKRVVK